MALTRRTLTVANRKFEEESSYERRERRKRPKVIQPSFLHGDDPIQILGCLSVIVTRCKIFGTSVMKHSSSFWRNVQKNNTKMIDGWPTTQWIVFLTGQRARILTPDLHQGWTYSRVDIVAEELAGSSWRTRREILRPIWGRSYSCRCLSIKRSTADPVRRRTQGRDTDPLSNVSMH